MNTSSLEAGLAENAAFIVAFYAAVAVAGLVVLALSYFRLTGWLGGMLGLAGLASLVWGLVIGLRRRDFRAMRHEYGGDGLPPGNQDQER